MGRSRRRVLVAAAAASLILATGCGANETKENSVTTVSGSCGAGPGQERVSPIPVETLERTLGPGKYQLSGSVRGAGTAADPLYGFCRYLSVDEDDNVSQRMELQVNYRGGPDSSYDTNLGTLRSGAGVTAIAGGKGYVRVTSTDAYGGGDGEGGSGVLFDGDTVYSAQIIAPARGVDGGRACEELVTTAARTIARAAGSS